MGFYIQYVPLFIVYVCFISCTQYIGQIISLQQKKILQNINLRDISSRYSIRNRACIIHCDSNPKVWLKMGLSLKVATWCHIKQVYYRWVLVYILQDFIYSFRTVNYEQVWKMIIWLGNCTCPGYCYMISFILWWISSYFCLNTENNPHVLGGGGVY